MAVLIDGKALAKSLREKLTQEVGVLGKKGILPGLVVILVGENPSSQIYVANKQKACEQTGIKSFLQRFPADISEEMLVASVEELNQNKKIHGILVQLPLPPHLNPRKILNHIDPDKDVDGLHPLNVGNLCLTGDGKIPCTPQGILYMIESTGIALDGKEACVVGRSDIVGKPTALLLTKKNATVTLCHSHTENLPQKIRTADILVAAIGKPRFIKGSWIKEGAVVIDVGTNRLPDGKITGDVDFETASKRAFAISPVPGGVGPMTIAMLLKNTLSACKDIERIS